MYPLGAGRRPETADLNALPDDEVQLMTRLKDIEIVRVPSNTGCIQGIRVTVAEYLSFAKFEWM